VTARSITVTATAFLTIAAGIVFAVGWIFCAATLHVPRKLEKAPAGASTIGMSVADGAMLSAWWLRPSMPNGDCVIVLHGIGDSRGGSAGFAPIFLDRGYSVLLPDSRAHGASGGEFVTYGLIEKYDVIEWASWMTRAGCRRVYGLGESLGASVLIEATAVRPVFAAIVAECPFADLRDIAEYRVRHMSNLPGSLTRTAGPLVVDSGLLYARWVDGLELLSVSPVSAISRTTTPTFLIHGLKDERTLPENSVKLARANPAAALWLIPGAGHTGASAAAPEEFRSRVLTWFEQHL
jgi:uncharacterized protein